MLKNIGGNKLIWWAYLVISVQLWNFKHGGIFGKINILKGNHCILRKWGAPVLQKLGLILENKVVQN